MRPVGPVQNRLKGTHMQDWQRSVIYQIYPKSFYSHGGQATGDLLGVVDKLDYLHWLGVDYLWLTPFLRSPQRDNCLLYTSPSPRDS